MKVLAFHLMSFRDLDDDFYRHHDSICVDIDPALVPSDKVRQLYVDSLDELELAASLGFDGVCVNEHHSSAYGMMPSPNIMAAALAHRTGDAAICVLGNSIVLYDPPTRVAEEFAMIDCLSDGRLIAGFPVGTPMDSAYAFGQNPSTLRQRYQEAHRLIRRAWQSSGAFAFNGRFYKYRYVNALPKPLQRPHPPIWIPAGGSLETWKWCVENDYAYCYLSYYGYRAAAELLEGYWTEVQRAGKPRNPYRAGFMQMVGVGKSAAEVAELYKAPAEYFYRNSLRIDSRFVSPPGHSSEETARKRAGSALLKTAASKGRDGIGGVSRDWDGILHNGYVVAGTPNEVTEQLLELGDKLNVGHLMAMLQFGSMSTEVARYNINLFAAKVLPRLRGRNGQWEDLWWPKMKK
jgi:alkanesulfonate monooxygenase SsuD/methylene tetrahydromethanopterin reductase-like flavin-dependent oxidoreductase (luciferase family)